MVVPVLMINCQVSLKLKIGPATAHKIMTPTAMMKAAGWPTAWALNLAKRPKLDVVRIAGIVSFDQVQPRIKNSRKSSGTGMPFAHKRIHQLYRFDYPRLKNFLP